MTELDKKYGLPMVIIWGSFFAFMFTYFVPISEYCICIKDDCVIQKRYILKGKENKSFYRYGNYAINVNRTSHGKSRTTTYYIKYENNSLFNKAYMTKQEAERDLAALQSKEDIIIKR